MAIRVRVNRKTGRAALYGLHISDLQDLIVAASLHNYDSMKEFKKEFPEKMKAAAEAGDTHLGDCIRSNALQAQAWFKRQRNNIKMIDGAMKADRPYQPKDLRAIPLSELTPGEIKMRHNAAKETAAFNKRVNRIVREVLEKRKNNT